MSEWYKTILLCMLCMQCIWFSTKSNLIKMYRVNNFKKRFGFWYFWWCFQWSRSLRHGYAATCLLELWVQILLRAQMSVCCDCCVLSGRGSVSVVLLSVLCLCSWSLDNEEALVHYGLLHYGKKKNIFTTVLSSLLDSLSLSLLN